MVVIEYPVVQILVNNQHCCLLFYAATMSLSINVILMDCLPTNVSKTLAELCSMDDTQIVIIV